MARQIDSFVEYDKADAVVMQPYSAGQGRAQNGGDLRRPWLGFRRRNPRRWRGRGCGDRRCPGQGLGQTPSSCTTTSMRQRRRSGMEVEMAAVGEFEEKTRNK
jgi:hypothetical protein